MDVHTGSTYGALYQLTDTASVVAQRRFLWATRARLYGLVVAALGGALSGSIHDVEVGGAVTLVAFLVAIAAEFYILVERPDEQWLKARAAAESIKTLTWRYMVGGAPLPDSLSDEEADLLFLARTSDVLKDLGPLITEVRVGTNAQITPEMRAIRAEPLVERQRVYLEGRISDQWNWYSKRSAANGARRHRYSLAALGCEICGVLVATLRMFEVIDVDLLSVLATMAASIIAWSQAKQYHALAGSYAIAAQELAIVRSSPVHHLDESDWSGFVSDAEEAISREHTTWRASRATNPFSA
jgi:SMODS and SLOG-associating 2TM effector domain 3/SMODS and SLOG-associating 2TM effector domain 1